MTKAKEKGRGLSFSKGLDWSFIGVCLPQIWIYCIAHRVDGALGEVELGVPLYLALSATMALVLAVAFRRPFEGVQRALRWPAAVVQGLATVLLVAPVGPLSFGGNGSVHAAAAVAAGAGVAWLYLQWAPFFARLDTKGIVVCVFAAMAVGSALKIPLDWLPAPVAAVVLGVLPALSVLACRRATAKLPEPVGSPRLFHEANPTSIPWRILIGVAAYSFVIGAVKGVPVIEAAVPFAVLTLVHHGVEILLALAVLWWVAVRGRRLSFSGLWRTVLLFTAATLFFLPVCGPAVAPWLLLGAGIAQTLVVMLLWAMLADVAHHSDVSPFVIFASGWIAYSLPLALGEAAGLVVGGWEASPVALAAMAYAVTVAVVLTLSDTAFSQRRIFADLEAPAPMPSAFASLDAQCEMLGREASLTAREVEVLQMIVKGRSKSYIAETLFISENTVRSHSKHIYQKLGVHSKQEVLDLLHR